MFWWNGVKSFIFYGTHITWDIRILKTLVRENLSNKNIFKLFRLYLSSKSILARITHNQTLVESDHVVSSSTLCWNRITYLFCFCLRSKEIPKFRSETSRYIKKKVTNKYRVKNQNTLRRERKKRPFMHVPRRNCQLDQKVWPISHALSRFFYS